MRLHIFEVTYDGSWMGGRAIVLAYTSQDAINMVKGDGSTTNFKDVKANGSVL